MLKVFETYTLERFNENFGTALNLEMSLDDFTDELGNVELYSNDFTGEVSYYYASYDSNDIVFTAEDEGYDVSKIIVYLIGDVYVYLVGDVYLATDLLG